MNNTKLLIQIPCYNEQNTLPEVLNDLPKEIEGIHEIIVQIIDDGSADDTIKVAESYNVNFILKHPKNRGLAAAFKTGVNNALKLKVDYLVNTDGDNQYCGADIEKMVMIAIKQDADLVIGCRPIKNHKEFSFTKKILQGIGSWVLRKISGTDIKDAASGFRVYSKKSLLNINIYSEFSYCMETLIQLGFLNMKILGVDISVNKKTRESRLFKNIFQYVFMQTKTIVNILLLYRSHLIFSFLSIFSMLLSFSLFFRYFYLVNYFNAPSDSFWPSIIVASILFLISIVLYFFGIIASLTSANRVLLEEVLYRNRERAHKES